MVLRLGVISIMNKAIREYYECLDGSMENKNLCYQTRLLEELEYRTRNGFRNDLLSNILGNAIFDGSVFLISKLFKGIRL